MKKFFTSDIHFDDNRLELFGRDILFKNSDEFDKQIIENWNSVVGENDIVYCLGDVSLSEKGLKNILISLKNIRKKKRCEIRDVRFEILVWKTDNWRYQKAFQNNKILSLSS